MQANVSFLIHFAGPRKEIPVLMHLISAMFDSQRVIDDYMDLQQWRTCYRSLYRVTSLLRDSKGLILGEYHARESHCHLEVQSVVMQMILKHSNDLSSKHSSPLPHRRDLK